MLWTILFGERASFFKIDKNEIQVTRKQTKAFISNFSDLLKAGMKSYAVMSVVWCGAVRCVAVWCGAVRCVAVWWVAVRCSAVMWCSFCWVGCGVVWYDTLSGIMLLSAPICSANNFPLFIFFLVKTVGEWEIRSRTCHERLGWGNSDLYFLQGLLFLL